eukprot:2505970-Alexandrium_andersonii.AAC.1
MQGPGYLSELLAVFDGLAGEREGDDKRRAFRSGMLELTYRKDESLTQFVMRRDCQMVELAGHSV